MNQFPNVAQMDPALARVQQAQQGDMGAQPGMAVQIERQKAMAALMASRQKAMKDRAEGKLQPNQMSEFVSGKTVIPQSPEDFKTGLSQPPPGYENMNPMQRMNLLNQRMRPYIQNPALDLKKNMNPDFGRVMKTFADNEMLYQKNMQTLSNYSHNEMNMQMAKHQELLARRSQITKQHTAKMQESRERWQDISDMKINPGRFFASMNTWQKILGFIGVAAAAVMHGRAGYDPNQAFVGINNLVEMDIAQQKEDLKMEKLEAEKLDLNDTKHLELLYKDLDFEYKANNNAWSIITGELSRLRDMQDDKRKAMGIGDLFGVALKTWMKYGTDTLDKQNGVGAQWRARNQIQNQFKMFYARWNQNLNTMGESDLNATGGVTTPNTQDVHEHIDKTGEPMTVIGGNPVSLPAQELQLKGRAMDKLGTEIMLEQDPQKQAELASQVTDWYSTEPNNAPRDGLSFSTVNLQGAKAYWNKDLSIKDKMEIMDHDKGTDELLSSLMDAYNGTEALQSMIDPAKMGGEVTERITGAFYNKLNEFVSGIKLKKIGTDEEGNVQYERLDKSEIVRQVKENAPGVINKMLAGLKLAPENENELKIALGELYLKSSIVAVRLIGLLTGEEGKRKSDKELALARTILGVQQLEGGLIGFSWDPVQTLDQFKSNLHTITNMTVDNKNRYYQTFLGNSFGGAQKKFSTWDRSGKNMYQIMEMLVGKKNMNPAYSASQTINRIIQHNMSRGLSGSAK